MEERFQSATPSTKHEYIDVHFLTAGVDVVVEHSLLPQAPEAVVYQVVQASAPVNIYQNTSGDRRAWTQGSIVLRSDVSNVVVRLLVTIAAGIEQEGIQDEGPAGAQLLPGDVTINGDLIVGGDSDFEGNVLIEGTLEVDGVASFDAAVDIDAVLDVQGVLTTQAGIDNTGGAIAFPAVQVPSSGVNTLDDYEEGLAANGASWTPSLLFGGAATGMTYGARGGWYTKVGRVVVLVGRFTLTAKGSSTGSATISGLPFASHTDTPVPSFVGETITAAMAALTSNPTVRVTNGSQILDLHDCGATGVVALDETNFTNTSVFTFSLTYLAAA